MEDGYYYRKKFLIGEEKCNYFFSVLRRESYSQNPTLYVEYCLHFTINTSMVHIENFSSIFPLDS